MKGIRRIALFAWVMGISISAAQAVEPNPWEARFQDLAYRAKLYREQFKLLNQAKPNPEQLKKLLGYYQPNEADEALFESAVQAVSQLTPREWSDLVAEATLQGVQLFQLAVDPGVEEAPKRQASRKVEFPAVAGDFIEAPTGVFYSKHVARAGDPGPSPILIGGGFPFNQTQFQSFNERIAKIADLDLYDPLCNGLSVLYDAVRNQGRLCRPYQAEGPLQFVKDELAFRFAGFVVRANAPLLALSLTEIEDTIFRLTRLSFHGISLVDQAHAVSTINEQQGYGAGQAILSGISYGGLITAKAGAMFPGRYKALVLFSSGVENPAHVDQAREYSRLLEVTYKHRQMLRTVVNEIAHSPRYDAYRPIVLQDHDAEFRDSLVKKMLGELDMDLSADMARIQDRVYMVAGALDAAVDPKRQIHAMREVFKKPAQKGSFVLIPKGGHALWGNPAQAAEEAVARVLEEVEKGEQGAFQDGGVYVWNEETASFSLLGQGLDGLARADALVDEIKAKSPK